MCSPLQITNKRLQTPQMCPSQADHKQLLTFTCSQLRVLTGVKIDNPLSITLSVTKLFALIRILLLFRWFKFTLKPPYSIGHDNLRLAIWDTSF